MKFKFRNFAAAILIYLLTAVASASPGQELGLTKLGEGKLRWFGLSLYTASLWSVQETSLEKLYEKPVLMTISYDRNISKERILKSTLQEWQRLDSDFDERESTWIESLNTIFPDIKAGDQISSLVLPDGQTIFYKGKQEIGRVDDAEFGPAFLSIWLDPNTRSKPLRAKLLKTLIQNDDYVIAYPAVPSNMYSVNGS